MSNRRRRYKKKSAAMDFLFIVIFLGIAVYMMVTADENTHLKLGKNLLFQGLKLPPWYTIVGTILALITLRWGMGFVIHRIRRKAAEKRLRLSGIQDIDQMTGYEFEDYLTVFFKDLGYKVEDHQGGKGDKGADKILIEPVTRKRICVQAKCWGKNISFSAVQEIFTAKSLYECDEAWIITNRGFTKQVRETADELGIDLWDRDRLMDNMYRYNQGKMKKAKEQGVAFIASPGSDVFHDLSCELGRGLHKRPGSLTFPSYNQAVQSGRRKCNCFK
ncbi:restriction endonuclease [Neobacillus pocheonensis]|uniref:restriction endonuclease n=1 Tax=Neobacillus pocheonensis TaxID=363869 RepID=UPI003D26EF3A